LKSNSVEVGGGSLLVSVVASKVFGVYEFSIRHDYGCSRALVGFRRMGEANYVNS